MKNVSLLVFLALCLIAGNLDAQMNEPMMTDDSTGMAHAVLPVDGIIEYLPNEKLQ